MNKDRIEYKIKDKPKLYYIYKCIKGIKNEQFVKDVIRMNECDLILNFNNYGELYPDKNIYYVKTDSDVRGFFSMFLLVLDALVIADRYHLVPIVEFGEHTLYYQGTTINESKNPFEYYFEPVSEIGLNEVFHCNRVLRYCDGQRNIDYNKKYVIASQQIMKDKNNSYISSRAYVCKKYIRLKPIVHEYIAQRIESVLGNESVLGVHVRGTDFNKGYLNHAKVVTLEQYVEAVNAALETNKFKRIFLATDEEKVVDFFRQHYGSKLFCYEDTLRSATGEALHFSTIERQNHKYMLGLEVLCDMMTLSACDGLIAGFSNVSLASRVMKSSKDENYKYLNIIDNGFNTSGIKFQKSTKLKKV